MKGVGLGLCLILHLVSVNVYAHCQYLPWFINCYILLQGAVSGTYRLKMRLVQYSNPSNIDLDAACCDVICSNPCDVYMVFCLRSIHSEATSASCWQQKSTQSSPISTNLINSPTTGPLYTGSPLSNPITFSGASYPVRHCSHVCLYFSLYLFPLLWRDHFKWLFG